MQQTSIILCLNRVMKRNIFIALLSFKLFTLSLFRKKNLRSE